MIEDQIKDLYNFVNKLIEILPDKQIISLNHNDYIDYSDIKNKIHDELDKRNLSKEIFFRNGDYKY